MPISCANARPKDAVLNVTSLTLVLFDADVEPRALLEQSLEFGLNDSVRDIVGPQIDRRNTVEELRSIVLVDESRQLACGIFQDQLQLVYMLIPALHHDVSGAGAPRRAR